MKIQFHETLLSKHADHFSFCVVVWNIMCESSCLKAAPNI